MKKIAGALIAMTLILSACSVWTQDEGINEIVQTNANYMAYDAQKVSDSDENKVLFFHASWCPDCVAANKSIAEASTTTWLKIFKIDFDDSVELRKKYGVTKQHTFVQIDANWELVKKWGGTNTLEEISAKVISINIDSEEWIQETSEVLSQSQKVIVSESEVVLENNPEENTENLEITANQYIEYSDDTLLNNGDSKVLFFHATWCPSCKSANNAFEEIDNTIGLDVVKVDYDIYGDLKSQYSVTSQHTFVLVDWEWNMLKRWYGSRNYADILEELQS